MAPEYFPKRIYVPELQSIVRYGMALKRMILHDKARSVRVCNCNAFQRRGTEHYILRALDM